MNTRQLEYAVAVAKERSFSKAAKSLIVSQPSLSQYIQRLEDELGILLFERTTPLRLTYAGEVFIKYAQEVLNQEKYMRSYISDIRDEKNGRIVIGAGFLNSTSVIPAVIKAFRQTYPDVQIVLRETVEPELFMFLKKDTIDFALTTIATNDLGMEMQDISEQDYLLAVSTTQDKNKGYKITNDGKSWIFPEISITDCKDMQFIVQDKSIPMYGLMENICKKANVVPKVSVQCSNIVTALGMVRIGLGVCLVPTSAAIFNIGDKDIHFYRIKENEVKRKLYIIYRKERYLTRADLCFIHLIQEMVAN